MVEDIFAFETMPRKFPIAIDAKYPSPTFDVKSPFASKLFRSVATVLVASDGSGDYEDIQKAINALPSAGGIVYIKEGTYTITTSITLASNVALIGAGKASKIQASAASEFNMLTASSKSGILIKGIYLYGSGESNSSGIVFITTTDSIISDCWVENCKPVGILIEDGSLRNLITNNQVNSNTGNGIYLQGPTNSENNTVNNNICTSNTGSGINIGAEADYTIVLGNQCNSNGYGIFFDESADCKAIGNICSSNSITGIFLGVDVDEAVIVGNVCKSNTQRGIYILESTAENNIVVGNVTLNNLTANFTDAGTSTLVAHNYPPVFPFKLRDTSGNIIFQLEESGTLKIKGDILTNEDL